MAMLGVPGGWHPEGASINIHCGGRSGGVEGFLAGFERLSSAAKDLLTVEDDEIAFGLDDLLPLAERLPIVLDLHHHWIKSEGRYIEPEDPRIALVAESWRGCGRSPISACRGRTCWTATTRRSGPTSPSSPGSA
jgi:UV DNA damage repair endonuclease